MTNKTLIIISLILITGIGFALAFVDFKPTPEPENNELATYFAGQLNTLGVSKVGQPIEGWNAFLLIQASPGFKITDFNDVETVEGHYELSGNEIKFVRDASQPITSVEEMISPKGYATLLKNVSARLQIDANDKTSVDKIINSLNPDSGNKEIIETSISKAINAFGVTITPLEVLEDSRCPVDVTCIWAGTVKVRATLKSSSVEASQIFELNKPITTGVETITLVEVNPATASSKKIQPEEYVFRFEVKKRPPMDQLLN